MTHASHPHLAYIDRSTLIPSVHIVAPRCFGAGRAPDGRLWIWMESVDDAFEQPWPVARHVPATRRAGHHAVVACPARRAQDEPSGDRGRTGRGYTFTGDDTIHF